MTAEELEECEQIAQRFLDLMPIEKRLIGLTPEQVARAIGGLTPEQLVAGLTPEQLVAGLTPEQLVAGLTPEQRVAVMPEEVLRLFSDELIDQLPEPTRSAVRARRGR